MNVRLGALRSRKLLVALVTVITLLGAGAVTAQATGAGPAQTSCSAPAWNSGATYAQGSVVSYNGHEWRATHWMWPGVQPGSGAPPWWVPWQDLGPCSPGTTTTTAQPGSTTTTTPGGTTTTTAPPAGSVDDHFAETGPWSVTTANVNVSGPGSVRLSYPTNLGANGVDHPVLVWASGSIQQASSYADTLDHLASWGYVVVAMSSPGFGGDEQLANNQRATGDYMVARNSDPSSPFFGNLDTANMAVFGHSQGANVSTMTIGTSRNSDDLFKTAVIFNLPDGTPMWDSIDEPVAFFTGTNDFLNTDAGQTEFFNQVSGPAAKAALVGAGHGGGLGEPSIQTPGNAYQGYLVAWFKYTLEGDQFARQAYAGSSPELANDSAFTSWQSKNLP